ncbi:hypothetical protein D0469_05630 [Peribacillus saganii]|uniref:EfeO-type cupredoxin-like domain-containing protein n=1 Tax=Peribacillus saganii TaxID=2303992 RepID=A0A372LST8_9BACI|nr:cupredoxin domain-containing protein [Peribacillus saganii]RFU70614.1 hypothetical protein D0469_05630 [Peribacillus saganii]
MFWFVKPLLVVAAFGSYLLFGFSLSKNVNATKEEMSGHEHHMKSNSIQIETIGTKYKPSNITVKSGENVSLILNNMDSVEHDLEIKDASIKSVKTNSPLHVHAMPNSKNTIQFTPLKAGIYEFYCTIPGHKEAGMIGVMKVTK